jgi:hypothetical protein
MSLEIQQEAPTPGALSEHGRISIAFVVDRILEVTLADGGLGGMSLTMTPVADPYVKDYDAIAGHGPARWAERFDVSNWGFIGACRDGTRVGGAVIAFRTADLHMRCSGTSGSHLGNGERALGQRSSARPRTGPGPTAAAG